MAKKKKRKKTKVISMNQIISPKKYIKTAARKLPVYKTYISRDILINGMGHAIVVREKRNGDKVLGGYLLDVWCLGVKNSFCKILDTHDFEDFIQGMFDNPSDPIVEADTDYTLNLVYGALEYAEDLGFAPHKDFSISKYILDPVEHLIYIDIPFGKNGKPYFVSGPYDNVLTIRDTLMKSVGPEGFDFTVEADPFD